MVKKRVWKWISAMGNDLGLSEVQRRDREIATTVEGGFSAPIVDPEAVEPLLSVLRDQIETLVGAARSEGEAFGRRAPSVNDRTIAVLGGSQRHRRIH